MTLSLTSFALAASASICAADGPRTFTRFAFAFPGGLGKLAVADLDRDGLKDLVAASGARLELYFQRQAGGFELHLPAAVLELTGDAVGWDLVDFDGSGKWHILAIAGEGRIRAWPILGAERSIGKPKVLLEGPPCSIPRGVFHLPLAGDVDRDGDADLVVPATREFRVYLRRPDETFGPGIAAPLDVRVDSRLDGGDLSASIGQTVTLPRVELRDVNGDGRSDVVAESAERLEVRLATPEGGFAPAPAFELDLEAARRRMGTLDPDAIDYSNLSALATRTVEATLRDFDGDGAEDVVVREGAKVSIYRGSRDGAVASRPAQVLKAEGNVVSAFLFDEDEDGALDLWLVRVESISLADLLLWLASAGCVDFEAFVYRNEAGRFGRRPARKLTVTLRLPSLSALVELGRQLERRRDEADAIAAARGDFTAGGARRDLAVLAGSLLRVFLDKAGLINNPDDLPVALGYRRDRDDYALDLEPVAERLVLAHRVAPQALAALRPDVELAVGAGAGLPQLAVLDLDGDRRDDVIAISVAESGSVAGEVIFSRP